MATVNDIVKKNKQINGTVAATPAVAGMSYLNNLSSPVAAASAATPTSASGSSSEEPGFLQKTWNAAVDGVNTGLDYLGGVGSAIAEGSTGVWNAVKGKREEPAPETETAAVSAPISYTANMGNTGMMTSSEYLADTAQSNDWYYNDKKDYLGKTKEDALRAAEQAKTDAKIEAEALFRQNASNYGLRGEQMLEQGLAGGGYSEFLEGKNMETRAANYARADANALAEAQTAQQNYDAAMNELNAWKKNADDKLRTEKLELSEQVRAERDAKVKEIEADLSSGLYTIEEILTLWAPYAGVYGELSQAEINRLNTIATKSEKSRAKEIYEKFINDYPGKGSKEEFINYLVGEGMSVGRATDMANAIFAAAEEQQNQLIGSSLAALGEAVRGGMSASTAAELFKLQNGKELTAEQLQSLQNIENERKTNSEAAEIEALFDKTILYTQSLGEDATRQKVEAYIKTVEGYKPEYDAKISSFLDAHFNPDGSLNVNNRPERATKLEELYASGATVDEANMILEAWGYEGLSAVETDRFVRSANAKAVQSFISGLAASEGFTRETLQTYLKTMESEGKIGTEEAEQILDSYFTADGKRIELETTGESAEFRKTCVTTMLDAIRAGTYNLKNAENILKMQLGDNLTSLEKEAINAAYEEYKAEEKRAAIDSFLAMAVELGVEPNKKLMYSFAVETLNMDAVLALELVDSCFDEKGNFIYNAPTADNFEKDRTNTSDFTREELLDLLDKLGIKTEAPNPDLNPNPDPDPNPNPDPNLNPDPEVLGMVGWDDYIHIIEDIADRKGITLTDGVIEKLKKNADENGMYPLTLDLATMLKEIVDSEGKVSEPGGGEGNVSSPLQYFRDKIADIEIGPQTREFEEAYEAFKRDYENGHIDEKSMRTLNSIFGDGALVTTTAKWEGQSFNTSYSSGDNFTVILDGTVYPVESQGKANDRIQTIATSAQYGIDSGEVFGYGRELYIKIGNTAYKIGPRPFIGNGRYKELWHAIYDEQLGAAISGVPLAVNTGNENAATKKYYSGGDSIENVKTQTETTGEVTGSPIGDYEQYLTQNYGSLKRGYAHLMTGKKSGATMVGTGGGDYVRVSGAGVSASIGKPITGDTELGIAVLSVANACDDNEVFVYGENLYVRRGDKAYELNCTKKQKAKIKAYIEQNSKDSEQYTDAAVKLEGTVDKEIPEKIEGVVYTRLALGENKYGVNIQSVLGETSDAVRAARAAGIKDGEIFAHHEDMYIFKVDEDGNARALKLSATSGWFNKDYDKFKEASTGKAIKDGNVFGNYADHLMGDGEKDDNQEPAPDNNPNTETENETSTYPTNKSYDEMTREEIQAVLKDRTETLGVKIKYYFSKEEIEAEAEKLGIKDVDSFIGKLDTVKKDGQTKYVWMKDDVNKTLSDLAGEGQITFNTKAGVSMDANGNLQYRDADLNKHKLNLLIEEVGQEYGLYGTNDRDSGLFIGNGAYGGDGSIYFYDQGKRTIYKIAPDSVDFEKVKSLLNGGTIGTSGGGDDGGSKVESASKIEEVAVPREMQKSPSAFESDAFGRRTDLGAGDNFNVEIGGTTYRVESGGEVSDEEVIQAANEAQVFDGEVFKFGEEIYLKKNDKYYLVQGRPLFYTKDAEKLSEAMDENAGKIITPDAKINYNGEIKYHEYPDLKSGDKLEVVYDGDKYKVTARTFYGADSPVAKVAENVDNGYFFEVEGDVYLKAKDGVFKITRYSKREQDSYDIFKTKVGKEYVPKSVNGAWVEVGTFKNKATSKYVEFFDPEFGKEKFWIDGEIDLGQGGNMHLKEAAEKVPENGTFIYGNDEALFLKRDGKLYKLSLTNGEGLAYIKNSIGKGRTPDDNLNISKTGKFADGTKTYGGWAEDIVVDLGRLEIKGKTSEKIIDFDEKKDVYRDANDENTKIGEIVYSYGEGTKLADSVKRKKPKPLEIFVYGNYLLLYAEGVIEKDGVEQQTYMVYVIDPEKSVLEEYKTYDSDTMGDYVEGLLGAGTASKENVGDSKIKYSDFL